MKQNIYNLGLVKRICLAKQSNLLFYNKGFIQAQSTSDVSDKLKLNFIINGSFSFLSLTANIARKPSYFGSRVFTLFCVNANFNSLLVLSSISIKQNYGYVSFLRDTLASFFYLQTQGVLKRIFLLRPKKGGFIVLCNGLKGMLGRFDAYFLLTFSLKRVIDSSSRLLSINNKKISLNFLSTRHVFTDLRLKTFYVALYKKNLKNGGKRRTTILSNYKVRKPRARNIKMFLKFCFKIYN